MNMMYATSQTPEEETQGLNGRSRTFSGDRQLRRQNSWSDRVISIPLQEQPTTHGAVYGYVPSPYPHHHPYPTYHGYPYQSPNPYVAYQMPPPPPPPQTPMPPMPANIIRATSPLEARPARVDRAHSDDFLRKTSPGYGSINRKTSAVSDLLPTRNSRPPLSRSPKQQHGAHERKSSISRPKHVRSDSATSLASQMSVLSDRSVVTDIAKSTLYKEVTSAGLVRMHLPIDNVSLVMDDRLEIGKLYQASVTDEDHNLYMEYHLQSEDQFIEDPVELPETRYVLAVDSGLYRRMLGEISSSQEMPCGLFFCGHHEDVDKPSIFIAVAIVGIVFALITLATFMVGGI